jgi:hypothetical protein
LGIPVNSKSVTLNIQTPQTGEHKLTFEHLDNFNFNADFYLIDSYTQDTIPVSNHAEYTFNIDGQVESKGDRFKLLINRKTSVSFIENNGDNDNQNIDVVSNPSTTTGVSGNVTQDQAIEDSKITEQITSVTNINKDAVEIYPNPVGDETSFIKVKSKAKLIQVEIINAKGQRVRIYNTSHIDAQSLDKGLYLVKVTTQEGTSTHKLVKE